LDKQQQCIRDVANIRTSKWTHSAVPSEASLTSLIDGVNALTSATKKTRSAIWCAMQLTLKEVPY